MLGQYVAEAIGGLGRTYDLGATKACIERQGRPVRGGPDGENFVTLEVGPFHPGRRPAAFTFAPTAKAAKSFNEEQSALDERIGNVIVRGGGTDREVALAKRCLNAKVPG